MVNTAAYAPASLSFRSRTIGRLPDGSRARLEVQQVAATAADGTWVYTVETVDIVNPAGDGRVDAR
ncbi:MAG: hypothetical protein MZW92_01675 [Comamonadaceae bacterium]|nr:hypothetical protein [Comamonadaceae bacterium]